ncbi:MAG: repressor LexA [Gemmatimonadetes bacterium]|nr:transcriptional repressor LexA [Gemmatimonadota bacterium]NNF15065.1 repressor LexA [Gemmatimonadota bacterium]NNL31341.1 repressor LexA [Gemmatimonadota bacterium]
MARSDAITPREAPTTALQGEPLTEIERKILDFMVQYLRENTYQPSIREIGQRFGIKSTKTVSEHLQALADKGCLERDPSRSRGVRILGVDLSADTVAVPCFSEVPAQGMSTKPDAFVSVDRQMGSEDGSFMVRAGAGDLAVLGVAEGDLVLVSPVHGDEIEDGTIVVAEVGDSSTFHRYTSNGRGTYLEALQPGGERTLVEDLDALHILGRVAGFYRRMDEAASANLTPH